MATRNLAQAKRDAKRPVGEPPMITVQVPLEQWGKLLGMPFTGPPVIAVTLPIAKWRKLLGEMSVRQLASRLPMRSDGRQWSASYVSRFETGLRGGSEELRAAIQKAIAEATHAA
jgi:hypothetical protein